MGLGRGLGRGVDLVRVYVAIERGEHGERGLVPRGESLEHARDLGGVDVAPCGVLHAELLELLVELAWLGQGLGLGLGLGMGLGLGLGLGLGSG